MSTTYKGVRCAMLYLDTDVKGKQMTFGDAKRFLKPFGIIIGDNWEYDRGIFDGILHRENGETIYLRMPFIVVEGELDHERAVIEFKRPFIIKHVVNLGIDKDSSTLLAPTGISQFQKPLDRDGYIHDKSKWQEFGEEVVGSILDQLRS